MQTTKYINFSEFPQRSHNTIKAICFKIVGYISCDSVKETITTRNLSQLINKQ